MAIRRSPGPNQTNQQIFKPRASVFKFAKFFPMILAALLVVLAAGFGGAYMVRQWLPMWWMMPLFMSFPIFSVVGGMLYANRLTKARVVIDQERLRIIQGDRTQANLSWSQITRLTVRQERGDNVYELWVRNEPIQLPAAFFEDGEKLLQAVSARTRRPWERAK